MPFKKHNLKVRKAPPKVGLAVLCELCQLHGGWLLGEIDAGDHSRAPPCQRGWAFTRRCQTYAVLHGPASQGSPLHTAFPNTHTLLEIITASQECKMATKPGLTMIAKEDLRMSGLFVLMYDPDTVTDKNPSTFTPQQPFKN